MLPEGQTIPVSYRDFKAKDPVTQERRMTKG
jgi:hypothetical protein